jgi:hypothetical protein
MDVMINESESEEMEHDKRMMQITAQPLSVGCFCVLCAALAAPASGDDIP